VGTLVTFDLTPPDWRALAGLNRQLGQDVFNPPNVKGWPGGDVWINSSTLLTRKQFLDRLSHDAAPSATALPMPMARWMNMRGREARIRRLVQAGLRPIKLQPDEWTAIYHVNTAADAARLLLAVPPAQPLPADMTGAQAIAPLLLDPAYQVH
jgi:hypothetical protein